MRNWGSVVVKRRTHPIPGIWSRFLYRALSGVTKKAFSEGVPKFPRGDGFN